MSQTTWSGPLQSGDKPAGAPGGPNIGQVFLSQTFLVTADNTLTQSNSIILPANSQIVEIYADVLTVYNGVGAASMTIGTVGTPTQYVTSVNAKTGGRNTTTHSAAQCTAMANIGTNTSVVATVTSGAGTAPSAGQVRVTIQYVQTTSSD